MRIRRNNSQPRERILPRRRPPQHRQQQKRHQKRRHHIHRHRALVPLGQHASARHNRHRRILHHDVQPVQPLRPLAERLDALEAGQVQRPHLHDVPAGTRAAQDGRFGRFSALGAAAGEDDLGCVEACEVPRGFEADADVGAGYDDGLAGEVVGWIGEGPELVVEEGGNEGAASWLVVMGGRCVIIS